MTTLFWLRNAALLFVVLGVILCFLGGLYAGIRQAPPSRENVDYNRFMEMLAYVRWLIANRNTKGFNPYCRT